MNSKLIRVALVICILPLQSYAQTHKTPILVFGTSHLHHMEGFETTMLDNVIATLDSFDFEVICIEKMPGELLGDIQSRKDSAFDWITKGGFGAVYLSIADTVRKMKGMPYLAAKSNIQKLLNKQNLTAGERKQLLFYYLATTDLPSATLQYQYIDDKALFTTEFERYIAHLIEKEIASNNEYYSIAARLAKLEHINKLEPIDNFQDESLLLKFYPGFVNEYMGYAHQLKQINQLPVYQTTDQLTQKGLTTNDLSDLYSFLNSDEYKQQDHEGQWKVWLESNFPSGADRARYSLWEMRNLQITANIMKVIARNPGKKTLVIIGASHVGFIEKYLKQMEHIDVLNY